MEVRFFVPGKVQPGGSKSAFYSKALGHSVIVDACKHNAAWKKTVKQYAAKAYKGQLLDGPLKVTFLVIVERPKSHYGTGRNAGILKKSARLYPTVKPDLTKLFRSTEDAITGVVWVDDAQVVIQNLKKKYGKRQGAYVVINTISEVCA